MNIDILLSKLDKPRQTAPNKWLACCPAHDDRSPSLAIKTIDDGKILLHCFSGCSVSEIVESLSLKLADLMPESPRGYGQARQKPPRFNKSELFDLLIFESLLIALAIKEMLSGRRLDEADLLRIERAESLIFELVKEVRS